MKKKNNVFKIVSLIILSLYALSIFFPLLWGVLSSLKTADQFRDSVIGLPPGSVSTWAWDNFPFVLDHMIVETYNYENVPMNVGLYNMIINTIMYACGGAFFATVIPMITAYATSKFDFRFNKVVYSIVVITMIMPIVGAYPSEIQLLNKLHMYNQMWGSWIQKANFLSMYYLIFLASFNGIAKEYTESARIDGASELKIMLKIICPLVSKVFLTVYLIIFINFWNDYQTPLLYLPSYPTLAYGVYDLSQDTSPKLSNVPMRMAGCICIAMPIIILFIIFRNKMMGNMTMGGIKG